MDDNCDEDLAYLRRCLGAADLVPVQLDDADKNLLAFASKEALVEWYSQPPGQVGEPYRDRGFYCRELAMLSCVVQPRSIVEFGTSLGIGTCLLRWLNPSAHIASVDVNQVTYLPGDRKVLIGYIAELQCIDYFQWTRAAHLYEARDIDLCFVDADHTYPAVLADSGRAWMNRSRDHRAAIAWHDHNDRHPGVVAAVAEFCAGVGVELQSRPDSDTVWIITEPS